MEPDARPVAQGKCPIPIQFNNAVRKKLDYMKENGLVEGLLNVDTKRMTEYLVQKKIPTTEELRHELEGSDRFTALDCRDSFFHFLLDKDSQELFKFHEEDSVYRFLVLVMGTPPASGECHTAMSKILEGLRGVIVIKDNILVHGKGEEHDRNLEACLQWLYEYGIRLRREKCKMGQQAVMWFGHIYTKQGMSADPAKVQHVKAWPAPK